jgi:hypothetical protein
MRRSEIVQGVRAIYVALRETEMLPLLDNITDIPASTVDTEAVLPFYRALKQYLIFAQSYNEAAREVARVLGIDKLEDPSVWTGVIDPESRPKLVDVFNSVRLAIDFMPKLLPLFENYSLHEIEQNIEKNAPRYKDMRLLTINIYEDKNTYSSPLRIVNAIESVNHFYYACAMLDNKSPTTLSVVACDSGSDKSFDFLGLAQVMECVERILRQIWERVFLFREHQLEERLDLVAKALPIVAQIARMKEHNEIDPELAELIEQNILNGTNKFIQSGATTKKIEDTSHYRPRALLTPVQRLLVSAPEDETEATEDVIAEASTNSEQPETSKSGNMNFENLSPEERETLRKLFEKATTENSPPREDSDEVPDV